MPFSPLCLQHTLTSLRTLKIPCPPFFKRRPSSLQHTRRENISKMSVIPVTVASPNAKRNHAAPIPEVTSNVKCSAESDVESVMSPKCLSFVQFWNYEPSYHWSFAPVLQSALSVVTALQKLMMITFARSSINSMLTLDQTHCTKPHQVTTLLLKI